MNTDPKMLIHPRQIEAAVNNITQEINEIKLPLTACIVLESGLFFASDIIRRLDNIIKTITVTVKNDKTKESINDIKVFNLRKEDVYHQHILIFDGIIDTGRTILQVISQLVEFEAESIIICTFLDKQSAREVDGLEPDFSCYKINKEDLMVGYGIDYNGKYRNLPYIGKI